MIKRNWILPVPNHLYQLSSMAIILGGALGVSPIALSEEAASAQPSLGTSEQKTGSAALEEVVVTATRRRESVLDIPISISAVSEKQLQQAGALQVQDVVRMVPGLAYTENSAGQAVLAVRGIQTSAVFGNVQQAVALYYDDVPVLDLTIPWTVPRLQLFDVNRVEVLRGPQGTLFGAGALSGAIRIITNTPDLSDFHAATEDSVTSTQGGGVGGGVNVMVNAPLIRDQLAVRVVGYYDYTAGWIDNPTLGDNRTNHGKVYGGRVEAKWKPTESFELLATASQEVSNPHDSAYVLYGSKSDTADFRVRNYNTDNDKIFNLAATYSMPWATLTSSTSYIDRHATSSLDFSGFANLLTGLTAVSPLGDQFDTNNLLQEVRLASSQEHPFKWLVGAFFEHYHFNLHEQILQAGVSGIGFPTDHLEDVGIRTKIDDQAVFGEVAYDIAPALTLTAGGRYSHYSIHTTQNGALSGTTLFDGPPSTLMRSSSNSAVTPKVSLSYKPSGNVMLYALASKGFRTGNSNLAPAIDPFTGQSLPQSYKPDTLWNYELGSKLELFDRRLNIDAALFYIDWKKIQLQVRAPSGLPYTDNAGSATSKGVELQVVGTPVTSTEIGTSLAFTDAKLTAVSPGVPAAQVGDKLPGSAPFTAYVYGQYRIPVSQAANLILRMDYSYTGREFSDLGNKDNSAALRYGQYSETGARATLQMGRYEFGACVNNLMNKRDRIAARAYYFENVEVLQTPRTVGLTLRAKW